MELFKCSFYIFHENEFFKCLLFLESTCIFYIYAWGNCFRRCYVKAEGKSGTARQEKIRLSKRPRKAQSHPPRTGSAQPSRQALQKLQGRPWKALQPVPQRPWQAIRPGLAHGIGGRSGTRGSRYGRR